MNPNLTFLADLTVTLVVCSALVLYIAKHLRLLLIELCGSAQRANFWLAFSNVCLVLVPVIFALDYHPEANEALILEIAAQLRHALIGFLVSFAAIAVILLWYIPRNRPASVHTSPK